MEYNYEDMIENLTDGVYFVDKDRKITYWNKSAEKITGYSSCEVLGKACSDNILIHVDSDGNNLCQNLCPLAKSIADGISREAEVYLHHKDGHRVPVWIRVTPLRDQKGNIVGASELFADNSLRSAIMERLSELEKLALIDSLTKLSNRAHIEFELEARLQELKRYGMNFGILFMDIDHFKHFNDTYGHDAGDAVLKVVSNTLRKGARPFDLYGRWGGEEFLGIIRNVDLDSLAVVGERCRMLVEKTVIPFEEKDLHVTISLGATLAIKNDSVESVVKRADQLLYKSKANGRNRMTIDS